jgi:hypothetical protein
MTTVCLLGACSQQIQQSPGLGPPHVGAVGVGDVELSAGHPQRPVNLDQLASQLGLTVADTARLLHLTWQERVDLRDGMIRLDLTPAGPRRYRVHAGGRPVGPGKT